MKFSFKRTTTTALLLGLGMSVSTGCQTTSWSNAFSWWKKTPSSSPSSLASTQTPAYPSSNLVPQGLGNQSPYASPTLQGQQVQGQQVGQAQTAYGTSPYGNTANNQGFNRTGNPVYGQGNYGQGNPSYANQPVPQQGGAAAQGFYPTDYPRTASEANANNFAAPAAPAVPGNAAADYGQPQSNSFNSRQNFAPAGAPNYGASNVAPAQPTGATYSNPQDTSADSSYSANPARFEGNSYNGTALPENGADYQPGSTGNGSSQGFQPTQPASFDGGYNPAPNANLQTGSNVNAGDFGTPTYNR